LLEIKEVLRVAEEDDEERARALIESEKPLMQPREEVWEEGRR